MNDRWTYQFGQVRTGLRDPEKKITDYLNEMAGYGWEPVMVQRPVRGDIWSFVFRKPREYSQVRTTYRSM